MWAIGTSILFRAIQRSAEEVSRRIATGTVDIEIFEIVAHLGRRHATVDSKYRLSVLERVSRSDYLGWGKAVNRWWFKFDYRLEGKVKNKIPF
jgi:hypothetical protein